MKKNGKEFIIDSLVSLCLNLAVMVLFCYLHIKHGIFPKADIPHFTTVAIVLSAFGFGIICYVKHKTKNDVYAAVFFAVVFSFIASFIGSVCGAILGTNFIK